MMKLTNAYIADLKQEIENIVGSNGIVSINEVLKGNTIFHGVSIRLENEKISPVLYLENVLEGDAAVDPDDIREVAKYVINAIAQYRGKNPELNVNDLIDWETAKDRLSVCLVNTKNNEKMLDGLITKEIFDLSVYVEYKVSCDVNGKSSAKIPKSATMFWGKTEEQILDVAWANLEKTNWKIRSLADMLSDMLSSSGIENDDFQPVPEPVPMIVVTNEQNCLGAAGILYTPNLDKILDEFGVEKLVILPSSVHECIVLPVVDDVDASEFENMIREVNTDQVSPEEQLSDHPYFYTKESGLTY